MTVTHSVAEVLQSHVQLEPECIDRMYLNVYVPQRSSAIEQAAAIAARPRRVR